jgi:hypothetical protein
MRMVRAATATPVRPVAPINVMGESRSMTASLVRRRPVRLRPARVLFLLLVVLLLGMTAALARPYLVLIWETHRSTPVYDPPVLAGQQIIGGCAGGVYARTGDGQLVITTSGHCVYAGQEKALEDGRVVGMASAPSAWAACDRPGKNRCTSSDMAYITLVPAMIPWGHLNLIDLGAGGYRTVMPGEKALSCADVKVGDQVEIDGHAIYRTGKVLAQQANDFAGDGTYFPCITVADITVMGGDSGGVVLVNGTPAGVSAREYSGYLGFTPLAEGLAEMGLTLCDTPDCGLVPPAH